MIKWLWTLNWPIRLWLKSHTRHVHLSERSMKSFMVKSLDVFFRASKIHQIWSVFKFHIYPMCPSRQMWQWNKTIWIWIYNMYIIWYNNLHTCTLQPSNNWCLNPTGLLSSPLTIWLPLKGAGMLQKTLAFLPLPLLLELFVPPSCSWKKCSGFSRPGNLGGRDAK